MYISDEKIRKSDDYKQIKTIITKFEQIEEKQKCARVRFLDWLSDRLSAWSVKVKTVSNNIQSPCSIKIK